MSQEAITVRIHIGAGPDADDEEIDRVTRQLLDDLAELDDISAELAQGEALPKGAMGDPIAIGTVLLELVNNGPVISGVISAITAWFSRDKRRSATLEIGGSKLVVDGLSKEEQTKLVEWFQTQTGLRLDS